MVPQEATTFNIGATYRNEGGLTLSADFWDFDYDGYITYEQPSAVLATDPSGPQVLRGLAGNVIQVTGFASNAGFLKTNGVDISASYDIETDSGGSFTPYLDSTYILKYDIDDPTLGPIDVLGVRNFNNIGSPSVEVRANLGLRWSSDNHAANVVVRYIGDYESDERSSRLGGTIVNQADYLPVDSMTVVDAQYNFRFTGWFGSDTESTVRLGVRNAFDEIAPPVFGTTGYDPLVHDPTGRWIYLSLTSTFK